MEHLECRGFLGPTQNLDSQVSPSLMAAAHLATVSILTRKHVMVSWCYTLASGSYMHFFIQVLFSSFMKIYFLSFSIDDREKDIFVNEYLQMLMSVR